MGTRGVKKQPFLAIAALLLACQLLHADDQDKSLPSQWRQGIATFYGGAPDGMVSIA